MKTRAFIDWLSITLPGSKWLEIALDPTHPHHERWLFDVSHDAGKFTKRKGMWGYAYGAQSEAGVIVLWSEQVEMGVHLIYSGAVLAKLESDGLPVVSLLRHHHDHDAKCTRVDIAVDVLDEPDLTVEMIADFQKAGLAECRASRVMRLQNNDGGDTLYVGSRASERYLRIYNKLAEQASKHNVAEFGQWIRIELECKGDYAHQVYCTLATSPTWIAAHIPAVITNFFNLPANELWQACMSAVDVDLSPSARRATNTYHWLVTSVSKTLAREIAIDPLIIQDFMIELVKRLDDLST